MNQRLLRISFFVPSILGFLFAAAALPAYAQQACHKGASDCPSGQECSVPTNAVIGVCVQSGGTGQVCHKGLSDCPAGLECNIPTDQTTGTCVVSGTGGITNPGTGGITNPGTGGITNPGTSGGGTTLQNPLKDQTLPALLNDILGAVVQIGAILLTLMLVWVGFMFVTARGNEEKIREARSALIWTVVGGLILLGAQAISLVIQNTVGALGP